MRRKALLLFLLFLLLINPNLKAGWKWRGWKWKREIFTKKVLYQIVGLRKGLKIGSYCLYFQDREGKARVLTYAWGPSAILCYSLPEGELLFSIKGTAGWGGPWLGHNFTLLGDINGDGYPEIATPEKWSHKTLLIFSAKDGSKLKEIRLPEKPAWTTIWDYQILPTYDQDGDGIDDFYTGGISSLLLVSPAKEKVIKKIPLPSGIEKVSPLQMKPLPDIDGDGKGDILLWGGIYLKIPKKEHLSTSAIVLLFFSPGKNNFLHTSILKMKTLDGLGSPYIHKSNLKSISPIEDVNGDGYPEIVVTERGHGVPRGSVLAMFSGKSGEELWRVNGAELGIGVEMIVAEAKTGKTVEKYRDVVFADMMTYPDVDGDGISEIITSHGASCLDDEKRRGGFLLFSGKDGKYLQKILLDELKYTCGSLEGTIPDMDKDKLPEIMVGVLGYSKAVEKGGGILIVSSSILRQIAAK
ncbi:hypothetical protein J7K43_07910 [Candidatus Calescamantes bacterium]|nr:hypothetical protein [Candidatus Calescamantes bacterium]